MVIAGDLGATLDGSPSTPLTNSCHKSEYILAFSKMAVGSAPAFSSMGEDKYSSK